MENNFFGSKVSFGFSKKAHGSMRIGTDSHTELYARRKYLKSRGFGKFKIIAAKQAHSNRIKFVQPVFKTSVVKNTDALITSVPNICLTLSFADCFPVYFYNAKSNTIAIAHCGWRGISRGLIEKCSQALRPNKYLKVYIGPGIQKCHFEIKKDILENFKKYPGSIIKKHTKLFVDLPKIIKLRLLASGVLAKNIKISRACTYCEKNEYFSFRRDKPKTIEAMMGYICLK